MNGNQTNCSNGDGDWKNTSITGSQNSSYGAIDINPSSSNGNTNNADGVNLGNNTHGSLLQSMLSYGNNDSIEYDTEEGNEEDDQISYGSVDDSTLSTNLSASLRNRYQLGYNDSLIGINSRPLHFDDDESERLYSHIKTSCLEKEAIGAARAGVGVGGDRNGGEARASVWNGKKSPHSENNRIVSLFLFAIVFVCILAIAFLASPLSNDPSSYSKNNSVMTTNDGNANYSSHDSMNMDDINSRTTINAQSSRNGITLSSSSKNVFQHTLNRIPFTPISRDSVSVPASSIINPSLFHPSLRTLQKDYDNSKSNTNSNDANASTKQPLLKTPLPTGAFYTNLLLSKTTADQSKSFPIMVYPYGYSWSPKKLIISYPHVHQIYDSKSIRDIFQPDLTFTVEEEIQNRFCTYYDPLSVTLRYTSLDEEQLLMEEMKGIHNVVRGTGFETYLVQGSPYITVKYTSSTPIITALFTFQSLYCLSQNNANKNTNEDDNLCINVDESMESSLPPSQQDVTLKGTQFILQTRENLKWYVC